MDIEPKYETFGREVEFEDITPIKHVYQPGILNEDNFFNPVELRKALDEICGFSKKEIIVYFRNISGGIGCQNVDKNRKWWDTLHKFTSQLGKFPAGIEMEYWYGDGASGKPSPEFKEKPEPFQAFVRLFDNAIQGFSCFVSGSQEGVGFDSHRTNYGTLKSGEYLISDQKTLWAGTPDVFLDSATRLHNALEGMKRGAEHRVGISGYNGHRSEVRIISPNRGAVIGSLYKGDSMTLQIDSKTLEKIVEKHNADVTSHFSSLMKI